MPYQSNGKPRAERFIMRLTGFDVLDASIQATNRWFNELTQELNWVDRRKATYGEISDQQRVVPALLIDLWPATLRAA